MHLKQGRDGLLIDRIVQGGPADSIRGASQREQLNIGDRLVGRFAYIHATRLHFRLGGELLSMS